MAAEDKPRPHLDEIDLMRVVTALAVVGVHVTSFTLLLNLSALGVNLQNGVIDALHFTREVFLAITAFVLVYAYANRPLVVGTFWRKRGVAILLPYLFWSIVYLFVGAPLLPYKPWLERAILSILTGTASYQLYYVILTIEFYLVLPVFLPFVRRVGTRHPWRLLLGSGLLQLAILYIDHAYLETGPLSTTVAGQLFNDVQSGFLPLYQFYAVTGAVAALHMDAVRSFVQRRGSLVVAGSLAGLGLFLGRYALAVFVEHQNDLYASSVFQPAMVFYSLAAAGFLYWVGVKWATGRSPGKPWAQRFWSLLSDASFGIYLIHPLFISLALTVAVPRLPAVVPVAFKVFAIWGMAAGLTTLACVVLLYLPGLSRLIGRPSRWRWRGRTPPESRRLAPVEHVSEAPAELSKVLKATASTAESKAELRP